MAFSMSGFRDSQVPRIPPQRLEIRDTEIAHSGSDAADELVNIGRQCALVRDASVNAFGNEFDRVFLAILEVTIPGSGLHRAERAHAAVHFIGAALIKDGLARALFGAGKQAPNHDGILPK